MEREAHLLELCRYVVVNPVRAGVVARAGDWRWSSYRATAGHAPARAFEHREWILARFGADGRAALRAYRRFVAGGAGTASPWDSLAGPDVLGGAAFRDGLLAAAGAASSKVPRRARRMTPEALDALRARLPRPWLHAPLNRRQGGPPLRLRLQDHQGMGGKSACKKQDLNPLL